MSGVPGLVDPCPGNLSGTSAQLFLTLINSLFALKCPLGSPDNYPVDYSKNLKDGDEFDIVVIGSGSAGSVVANVLTEKPNLRVLVLEAGSIPSATSDIPALLFNLQGSSEDWQYLTEPAEHACKSLKNGRCRQPRGKALGGSSAINAMLYIRGNKRDYDNWAKLGCTGWDAASVEKYFYESEDIKVPNMGNYGTEGEIPLNQFPSPQPVRKSILDAAKEKGYATLRQEGGLGYFDAVQNINEGVRASMGKVFLGTIQSRLNLMVSLNSFVEKLVIKNRRVTGVKVNVNGKLITVKASKQVVLSAGTFNSAQLLMLSGIGPKDHLKALNIHVVEDLKVGENLGDHPMFAGFLVNIASGTILQANMLDEIYKYFAHRTGAFSNIDLTSLLGFINTKNSSLSYPDIEIFHTPHPKNDQSLLPLVLSILGVKEEVTAKYLEANAKSDSVLILPSLLNPKSKGKLLLNSTNPYDKILIYTNYLDDDDDMEILLEAVEYLVDLVENTSAMKQISAEVNDLKLPQCKNLSFKSRSYWKCCIEGLTTSVWHPVGTCRMGNPKNPNSVVDPRLRVIGIHNLRVIDASVMPEVTSGNTNAPTIMIGRKGANMLLEDLNVQ